MCFPLLGLKRKAVSRLNSLPALNSRNAKKGSVVFKKDVSDSIQALSHYSLEVGSMAEVLSLNGLTVYGVIRWIGVPEGKKNCWAGLELVSNDTFFCFSGVCVVFYASRLFKKMLSNFVRTQRQQLVQMGRWEKRGILPVR